jgi:hypothetical protein
VKTWLNCDHPRTLETALRGRLSYGCKLCAEGPVRPARFISRVFANALKPLHKHFAINNVKLGMRAVRILNAQTSEDRAAYLLLLRHRFEPCRVAECLGEDVEQIELRAKSVQQKIAATEHQNFYKDWKLVQQLIDEGIPEAEVRDMICITVNGWFKAKQRGDVRV